MARFFSLVPEAAAIAIFAMTYLVVAIGRLPGFRLDRAGAALVGASLMVAVGALPLEEAPKAIDFDTIILLLGVMIVVANLRLSGFFRLVNGFIVTRARHPLVLQRGRRCWGMHWRKFAFFNFLGAALWVTTISSVGYLFGKHWEKLMEVMKGVNLILLAGAIVIATIYWLKRKRRNAS